MSFSKRCYATETPTTSNIITIDGERGNPKLSAENVVDLNEQSSAEAQGDKLAFGLHCHSPVDSSKSYKTFKGQHFSGERKKQQQFNKVDGPY